MGSALNRWIDEEDRVYIVFTVEETADLMNCGMQKAVKLMKELDSDKGIGLIEKKRLGLGRPKRDLCKEFHGKGKSRHCRRKGETLTKGKRQERRKAGQPAIMTGELWKPQIRNY